jgi:hypothetical protein
LVRVLANEVGVRLRERGEEGAAAGAAAPFGGPVQRASEAKHASAGEGTDAGGGYQAYIADIQDRVLADFRSFLVQVTRFPTLRTMPTQGQGGIRSAGTAFERVLLGLTGTSLPMGEDSSTNSINNRPINRSILFLEDLPGVAGAGDWRLQRHVRERLGEIFTAFLQESLVPAVLVLSEGEAPGEAASKPALSRLLGASVLDSPHTTVISLSAVPDTRLRKVLTSVALAERVSLPGVSLDSLITGIISSARGDLRHALMSLQMAANNPSLVVSGQMGVGSSTAAAFSEPIRQSAQLGRRGKVAKQALRQIHCDSGDGVALAGDNNEESNTSALLCGRDDFLDSLHALGKLLYGKRLPLPADYRVRTGTDFASEGRYIGGLTEERMPLENDPDSVLAGCPYDAATTSVFLCDNMITFFESIEDLSNSLDILSAADVFLGQAVRSRLATAGGVASVYPEQTSAALIGRAISTFNRHPSPPTFRPVRKPAYFSVQRVRSLNSQLLQSDGLGWGPDLGVGQVAAWMDAMHRSRVRRAPGKGGSDPPFSLAGTRERALDRLPLLAYMGRAYRDRFIAEGRRRGKAISAAALPDMIATAMNCSPRVYALALASSYYGEYFKGKGLQEPLPLVGANALYSTFAFTGRGSLSLSSSTFQSHSVPVPIPRSHGESNATGDAANADDVDEDAYVQGRNEADDGVIVEADECLRPGVGTQGDPDPVSTMPLPESCLARRMAAGLVVGQWEAFAAIAVGVDAAHVPLLSPWLTETRPEPPLTSGPPPFASASNGGLHRRAPDADDDSDAIDDVDI